MKKYLRNITVGTALVLVAGVVPVILKNTTPINSRFMKLTLLL